MTGEPEDRSEAILLRNQKVPKCFYYRQLRENTIHPTATGVLGQTDYQ
jgi:hypothetical protein